MRSRSLRLRALFLLSLLVWPFAYADAAQTVRPVARNIAGSVIVQTPDGSEHEVIQSLILHSGDVVSTGPNSRAVVDVADVGRVVIGPTSAAQAQSDGSDLWLQISAGMLCFHSNTATVGVNAGPLRVAVSNAPAIFSIRRDAGNTTIAVYEGSVSVSRPHEGALTASVGQAISSLHDAQPLQTPFADSLHAFDALMCPDHKAVATALSHSSPVQAPATASVAEVPVATSHAGGGGVLGWILGLAAIGAAAGAHGGGGSNNDVSNSSSGTPTSGPTSSAAPSPSSSPRGTPTPTTSPSAGPTPTPSPTPKASTTPDPTPPPGALQVTQTSVNINGVGNSQNFQASETHYLGPISATTSNLGVASVSPSSGTSPVTFSVIANSIGNATISVSDNHGGQRSVLASVVIGNISVAPLTLSFASADSAPQKFSAHDPGAQSFSAVSSNPGVANVVRDDGGDDEHHHRATFSVTPTGVGSTTIFVSDDQGSQAAVSVGVATSPLSTRHRAMQQVQSLPMSVSATNLRFSQPLGAATISVEEPGYSGIFAVRSTNPAIATVNPPSCSGPRCVITVVARARGTEDIFISDDRGGQKIVEISVNPLPVMRQHERQ